MTVNIPFAFSAEDHFLPEGEYLVLTVTPERSIRIVSIDGKHSTIVNTLPNYASSPSVNSRLAFRRYGNEYFLAQVWTAGENVARNRCPARRQWRLPAAGLLYRRSRSLHTPIAANEFAVTEPSGRPPSRPFFCLVELPSEILHHPNVVFAGYRLQGPVAPVGRWNDSQEPQSIVALQQHSMITAGQHTQYHGRSVQGLA